MEVRLKFDWENEKPKSLDFINWEGKRFTSSIHEIKD